MKLHFVRSIRGLQNFLAIPIMNPLAGFMIYIYIYIYNIYIYIYMQETRYLWGNIYHCDTGMLTSRMLTI